jgi:hypothetical protein
MDPKAEAPVPPVPPPAPDPMPPGEAPAPNPPEGAIIGQPVPGPAPRVPMDKSRAKQELIFSALLFGAAVVVIGIIFGLAKWWARRQADDCENPSMSLSSFREMYENGELSQVEYEQIRNKMAAKMKGSLGLRPPVPESGEGPDPFGRNGTSPDRDPAT